MFFCFRMSMIVCFCFCVLPSNGMRGGLHFEMVALYCFQLCKASTCVEIDWICVICFFPTPYFLKDKQIQIKISFFLFFLLVFFLPSMFLLIFEYTAYLNLRKQHTLCENFDILSVISLIWWNIQSLPLKPK